jgi:hypothetical protein
MPSPPMSMKSTEEATAHATRTAHARSQRSPCQGCLAVRRGQPADGSKTAGWAASMTFLFGRKGYFKPEERLVLFSGREAQP